MQSDLGKASVQVEKDENDLTGSILASNQDNTHQESIDLSSSTSSSSSSDHESIETEDQTDGNASKRLVLYDPTANGTGEIVPVPEPVQCQRLPFGRCSGPHTQSRVLPSVGAFTVQCANCFKWRLIPTKEKYEEIREHVLENPFICEKAREWRPDITCDDPTDISQDGSRLWAIDKPNIAQPPSGWQRLLRIRGEGSTKFADVYYEAPSGKKLRSMVEVQKYLIEHPEYTRDGVTLSQFSFQIPKPLQENYVRKRPAKVTTTQDTTKSLEPNEVNPLAWANPNNSTNLRLGRPALPPPPFEGPILDPVPRPAKQAKRTSKQLYNNTEMCNQQLVTVKEPGQSRNSSCDL
ncbi:methyl-CpG-binding domain-containing protein 2-like [Mangifera indica]|uniref:methyl-CpG-binding domain-containing protein 2-like n=1 Tax=Mangifera indica TaxID=29780 RepID=UPI001CF93E6C|nr:methyl-CpG-binding domain-containing protein 2-like [Mangifera indica]XP_044471993.1 methyl-CpG-binding domain-containing protein 2-like [Mangifera indica]